METLSRVKADAVARGKDVRYVPLQDLKGREIGRALAVDEALYVERYHPARGWIVTRL